MAKSHPPRPPSSRLAWQAPSLVALMFGPVANVGAQTLTTDEGAPRAG
ncbi:MAG: hypothetical protein H7338_16790 [Candidatus Sericytochromatia bacterium]|nr:hypothetical protein [Candidatus Sericytochromatia bacterium]